MFRHGLRLTIDAEPDLKVVGEASSADEAVKKMADLHPQVVWLDLLAAIRTVHQRLPPYADPVIAGKALRSALLAAEQPGVNESPLGRLSSRELEVLRQLALGYRTRRSPRSSP